MLWLARGHIIASGMDCPFLLAVKRDSRIHRLGMACTPQADHKYHKDIEVNASAGLDSDADSDASDASFFHTLRR
jgi:hypothetical protein